MITDPMNDWITFLSAFPQPGEIHPWLLNQANYIGTHALYTAASPQTTKARPYVHTAEDARGAIATPYRLPSSAKNPVLHNLITLPGPAGVHKFVLSFGATPRLVLRGGQEAMRAMIAGCGAVGLMAQPAVRGTNVRVFHHRKQWFAASGRHLAHQRQPLASIPAPLRKLLHTLCAALQRRCQPGDPSSVPEGHNSIFWQQCQQALGTDRCWFFRAVGDDFYFLGSYPIVTDAYCRFSVASVASATETPLLQQVLPQATAGDEQCVSVQQMPSYHTDVVGTVIYNPVTLAALIVTQYHHNFLLYGIIEHHEPAATLMARLVFLTYLLQPLRPDVVDVPTQDWIRTVVGPFLETHGKALWPTLYAQLTGLVTTLHTETVPAWVACMQANPKPWSYPLLAALARPNRGQWVPLWEGDLWVRMLASLCA